MYILTYNVPDAGCGTEEISQSSRNYRLLKEKEGHYKSVK